MAELSRDLGSGARVIVAPGSHRAINYEGTRSLLARVHPVTRRDNYFVT